MQALTGQGRIEEGSPGPTSMGVLDGFLWRTEFCHSKQQVQDQHDSRSRDRPASFINKKVKGKENTPGV